MDIVYSKNEVPIRLTEERWEHITKNHDYMSPYYFEIMETIADPELIIAGRVGELIALKAQKKSEKRLVVICREISKNNGFVITAFLTKKIQRMKRRKILWQKS
ncbi:MAG: hypothetical protein QME05_03415 [Candidatus Margulisbacteria bacterium]|nr:hypothetical protein [Candidatus Margulisiibacteriota bacterium]